MENVVRSYNNIPYPVLFFTVQHDTPDCNIVRMLSPSRKYWWSCANLASLPPYGHQGKSFALEQQGLNARIIFFFFYSYPSNRIILHTHKRSTSILDLSLHSEDEAKLGARRLARCLQKIGFKVNVQLCSLFTCIWIFFVLSWSVG